MGLGISPLGSSLGPFGGPGLITVLGVLPVSNNSFAVVFDREPVTLDEHAADSAANEQNYTLLAVDPVMVATDGTVTVPAGEVRPTRAPYSGIADLDLLDPKQIIVSTDSALEPRVRYTVDISTSLMGLDGETFAGTTRFMFRGLLLPRSRRTRVTRSEDRYRDLDYIVNATGTDQNQTYRFEANNDIGIQNADTSLKKRIFRRVFTDPGGFAFAPGYGVGVKVKRLAKSGALQELANMISAQILQEPDVAHAGASVRVERSATGTFVLIDARVQRVDAKVVMMAFREPL